MKRIILFITLLITLTSQGQIQYLGSPTNTVHARGHFMIDSALYLSTYRVTSPLRQGALMYQISDSTMYVWTGNQWKQASGASSLGWYNVRDYGASPSASSAVNTAAINAAGLAAHTAKAGGALGVVYFPTGRYLFDSANYYNDVSYRGDSWRSTVLQSTLAKPLFYGNQDTMGYVAGDIRDLQFDGHDIGTIGLRARGWFYFQLNNLTFRHFTDAGIEAKGALIGRVESCYFDSCYMAAYRALQDHIGLYFPSNFTAFGPGRIGVDDNLITFVDCYFLNNPKRCWDWNGSANVTLQHCDFEQNGILNATSDAIFYNNSPNSIGADFGMAVIFDNCWAERNHGPILFGNTGNGAVKYVIQNCQFNYQQNTDPNVPTIWINNGGPQQTMTIISSSIKWTEPAYTPANRQIQVAGCTVDKIFSEVGGVNLSTGGVYRDHDILDSLYKTAVDSIKLRTVGPNGISIYAVPDAGGSGTGITSLNALTGSTQTFAPGTAGSDFGISSSGSTHTFNIPDAGASARGAVTTGTQTLAGAKTFTSNVTLNGITNTYVAKTSGYTATATDYLINATSGTFNVTLPTAVGITGKLYVVKNSGSGTVTVNTTSSQTIDAVTTVALTQWQWILVASDGANWKTISQTSGGGSTTLAAMTDVSISSPTNNQFLKYQTSDSKWHNLGLIAADIPTGSNNYVQNQNSSAQSPVNFWIDGTGTVGTLNTGGLFATYIALVENSYIAFSGTNTPSTSNYVLAGASTGAGASTYINAPGSSGTLNVRIANVTKATFGYRGELKMVAAPTAQTTDVLVYQADPTGTTMDATLADRYVYGFSGVSNATRSAGANNVYNVGGYFEGTNGTGIRARGIWAKAPYAANSYAGYFDGNTYLKGTATLDVEQTGTLATVPGVLFTSTADGVVTNTTTETTIVGTGAGVKTLKANSLVAGRTIRIRVRGKLTNTSTPLLTLKIKFGSTVVATTAVTLPSSLANDYIEYTVNLTCRTTGGSGTILPTSQFIYNASVTGSVATAVTVDTTIDEAIDVTATWGAASASNSITGSLITIEILN